MRSTRTLWFVLVAGLVAAGAGFAFPRGDRSARVDTATDLGRPTRRPATTSATTTSSTAPTLFDPATNGWTKVAYDEQFDGRRLTLPWAARKVAPPVGSGQLQCFRPKNATEALGSLIITAEREVSDCGGQSHPFSSGLASTGAGGLFLPASAYFEVRAKLPLGQGLRPAIRLRNGDGPSAIEVELMDYYHARAPGAVNQGILVGSTDSTRPANLTLVPVDGWHTFGVEVLPATDGLHLTFYTDGVETYKVIDPVHMWLTIPALQPTWDLDARLVVGGRSVGNPDDPLGELSVAAKCAQHGTYPAGCTSAGILPATFPANFAIDYVRVLTR